MPNRHLEFARLARERELHLERLARIEGRRRVAPKPTAPAPQPRQPNQAARLEHKLEQVAHARRMHELLAGTERRRAKQHESALAAGRDTLGASGARRRVQAEVAAETAALQQRLQKMPARFASPSAIALLTGRGPKVGGGGGPLDDESADE